MEPIRIHIADQRTKLLEVLAPGGGLVVLLDDLVELRNVHNGLSILCAG
jgi:hypothetical protein